MLQFIIGYQLNCSIKCATLYKYYETSVGEKNESHLWSIFVQVKYVVNNGILSQTY